MTTEPRTVASVDQVIEECANVTVGGLCASCAAAMSRCIRRLKGTLAIAPPPRLSGVFFRGEAEALQRLTAPIAPPPATDEVVERAAKARATAIEDCCAVIANKIEEWEHLDSAEQALRDALHCVRQLRLDDEAIAAYRGEKP
jgi:hypothetical protein